MSMQDLSDFEAARPGRAPLTDVLTDPVQGERANEHHAVAGRSHRFPTRQANPRDFQIKTNGRNRLLEAAMPLLGLAVRMRSLHECQDLDALHARLINEIQSFQQEIEGAGYDDATVLAARYVICAAVDEAVLSQTWGAESKWVERPLLSVYHNETWGGEKVFAILDRVMDEAHRFVDLLELIYYVIALGFEGRYHVMHSGQSRLEALLGTVHAILEKLRGPVPDRLLNPEPNIYETSQRMRGQFPIWGICGIAALVLIVVHISFDASLTAEINGIEDQINASLTRYNFEGF